MHDARGPRPHTAWGALALCPRASSPLPYVTSTSRSVCWNGYMLIPSSWSLNKQQY
ncbi:hypothetical protein PVAP13_5KG178407 [Panicum virgatum]|uniref:Uncharacterized protein n=1 Tax=Panicum virgatum TaxID=38727 RepID=A0A8T0SEA1_PANVG|nr:hypothetical protein PVAP13_5KG178407 [Panicum virgatum]